MANTPVKQLDFDLGIETNRKKFLQEVKDAENRERKRASVRDYDVLNDNLQEYVEEYLLSQFSQQTVLEMPIVTAINIAKRVAYKEASIYKTAPERTFTGLNPEQTAELLQKYEEWCINQKLLKANLYFKDFNQCLIQAVPKRGKMDVRILANHHYDVVPNLENPEMADSYVISAFDRSLIPPTSSDSTNQSIGDKDDYKSATERYLTWDLNKNFVFDGNGKLIGQQLENPPELEGEVPFIDVVQDKDFEYFVRSGHALTDFAVQFCGALSDLGNIVKMQGYAVAWMKGKKGQIPKNLKVGPSVILHLEQDELTGESAEFGFASPQSDIAGGIQYIETLLSHFLTSRGLDPSVVNGKMQSKQFNSGLDRLLSMLDQFEATQQDYDLFKKIEVRLFNLFKKWSKAYASTDDAFLSFEIPDTCELNVKFHKPEQVQTEIEVVDLIQKKMELGLMTKVQAIMKLHCVTEEKAKEMIKDMGPMLMLGGGNSQGKPPMKKGEDDSESYT